MGDPVANVVHANYRDEWETPPEFFRRLDDVFDFEVDLFASYKNALCASWVGKNVDSGLEYADQSAWRWANPPYGSGLDMHVRGLALGLFHDRLRTVALLPSNTDTKWFHQWVLPYAHIVFIKGRLQFLYNGERHRNEKGELVGNSGANILAIYGPNLLGANVINARAS